MRGGRLTRSDRIHLAALVLALSLSGCGGVALNRSFNDYAAVYADVSNRELLLNLARMANAHPPRFLQLGQISTTFQFGAGAAANVGETRTTGPSPLTGQGPVGLITDAKVWGASVNAAFNEQPTFGFTPLTGPEFAKGFLAAISSEVFFALLEQGEPVDQLLRALVQSVEYTDATSGRRVMLLNEPNLEHPERYVEFVRLAGIFVELQQRHALWAETTTSTVASPSPLFAAPTLDQVLRLADKGLRLNEVPGQSGKYALATVTTSRSLHVSPEALDVWKELAKEPYFRIDLAGLLDSSRSAPTQPTTHPAALTGLSMKLRSPYHILGWVAREQRVFDALAGRPGFLESLPPRQRRPVLRLTWEGVRPEELEPPLVALDYGGQTYAITDIRGHTWNRHVFTLLSYVASQVALDPKQLPVQQLINVQ